MSSFVFRPPFTQDQPPNSRRRRLTNGELEIDWERYRLRIAELYSNHTLEEVMAIMREEGLIASEKQFKKQLKRWEIYKYHKLTDDQLNLVKERLDQDKSTSFELRGTTLDNAKLRRTINRRYRGRGESFGSDGNPPISPSHMPRTTPDSDFGLGGAYDFSQAGIGSSQPPRSYYPQGQPPPAADYEYMLAMCLKDLRERYPQSSFQAHDMQTHYFLQCDDCDPRASGNIAIGRHNIDQSIYEFEINHLCSSAHLGKIAQRLGAHGHAYPGYVQDNNQSLFDAQYHQQQQQQQQYRDTSSEAPWDIGELLDERMFDERLWRQ